MGVMTEPTVAATTWHAACPEASLVPEIGVPVLIAGHPVAVFRTADDEVYAVGNVDPFSGASVMSRGIMGDRGGEPTVASPMHKQVFALRTGECLDDPTAGHRLPAYPVRRRDGKVEIGLP